MSEKSSNELDDSKKHMHFEETMNFDEDENDDLLPLNMKEKYFPNVPIEPEKLNGWVLNSNRMNQQQIKNKMLLEIMLVHTFLNHQIHCCIYRFNFYGN